MASDLETRIRNVTAVLGPTNTGKTHLAIERMLGHESGMIGLPLRLLAREVYDKIAARIGVDKVALITGEEKIKPERARYWVATVEAMPRDVDVDFLAIDEIQLAADPERGHVFTDRLLHARGRAETLLLGAQTMREAIQDLIPGANFISRPRLSHLTYAGEKKITRLPGRSAVVAFSANEVYAIAELIRRQRGGTAVVLGALSPRTRNAQVALYQSGDVDFLVATDAIGMGLNLDVDHVAFSAVRKFDGQNFRNLTPNEIGQIAGRAGRHMNDGTFGVTGNCEPFDSDLVERLETHTFDNVRVLQWRNRRLDFGSLDRLRDSLREMPNEHRLTRARMADDVLALETLANDREIARLASTPAAVGRLWEVCQIPDYRKISSQNHAELVGTLYSYLMSPEGRVPEDWFAKQVAFADRTDGDIDTLANRIAHIRTWTFVSNRADWLKDPVHWQGRTRVIEDSLSDALHEQLTQRFVDRRTSALMKGLRDKEELSAEIADDGSIHVENHFVGRLRGFRFTPETQAEGIHGKAARSAAAQVLSRELGMRARRVAAAKSDAFKLSRTARVLWRDEEIAALEAADDPLKPQAVLLADEHLSGPDREKVQARIDAWRDEIVAERLKPLVDIAKAEDVTGLARGIAFRLTESFGMLKRELIAEDMKHLDQEARAQLRKYGVRFGAFNIYFPALLKPAPAELSATLWTLKNGPAHGLTPEAPAELPRAGLTSAPVHEKTPEPLYRAYGFHVCGPRAVRLDILERLADLIRPLLAWRANPDNATPPPKGSTGDGGFIVTPEMMSILGCSPDELSNVLKALGFRLDRKTVPKPAEAAKETAIAADAAPAPDAPAATGDETAAADVPQAPSGVAPTAQDGEPASAPAEAAVPAEAGASDTTPPVEETVVIDIWRPRRHRSEDRPRHDRERREGGGRHQHGRRRDGASPEGTPAAPAAATSPDTLATTEQAATAARPEDARREAHRDRRPERGQHRDQDRNRSRPPRQRDDRRDDRRRREDRQTPAIRSAGPPPKKGGIDPDSPFASLGALRDVLAKQAKEKNPT
ncbi:helicase-related protein [Hyphomicrobium sp. CS1GBMeth3]|uniref:helicase-related protein n=1 Tax=Hyphomicrobium sp. CS1GBMeth3 TaxID=1892845 RepID=UPI000930BB89|nr:helicase-related protein [Hyphomicrobium sp. CS1GBMeth3]